MSASVYHHPHEHVGYDPMENADFERYQQRPVDYRATYSPNSSTHTAAAVVAAASEGWPAHAHTLAVATPDSWDSRVHNAAGGLPWPPHSHDNRYPTASMKWEPNTTGGIVGVGALSGGGQGYKKSKKLCSPGAHSNAGGSTSGLSMASDVIPDETLAHLTVKELNKRVQNLARDEVVALKQRRRTLKNRG